MHDTALKFGQLFFASYLRAPQQHSTAVLDIGGMDLNGTLRSVAPQQWRYVAADMASGKGVDVVLLDPYKLPFKDAEFDAVVSTSCFEHDACFWLTFLEMVRVTRLGGYLYLNAPSGGLVHHFPIDAWRFYPDASLALVEWARRSGTDVTLCESFVGDAGADGWADFVAIFRRGRYAQSEATPIHRSVACSNVHLIGVDKLLRSRSKLNS
jgi:SAM-dependent methyltransferase